MNTKIWQRVLLRNFPRLWKQAIVGYVLCLATGYSVALVQIAMVVGLTPAKISQHYHGVKAPPATTPEAEGNGEVPLDLEDDTTPLEPALTPKPGLSLRALVSLAHTHLFGMASFFFGLTALVLLTGVANGLKFFLAIMPWVAILVDQMSLFATRLWGAPMAYLTAFAGTLLSVIFAAQAGAILWELMQAPDKDSRG